MEKFGVDAVIKFIQIKLKELEVIIFRLMDLLELTN